PPARETRKTGPSRLSGGNRTTPPFGLARHDEAVPGTKTSTSTGSPWRIGKTTVPAVLVRATLGSSFHAGPPPNACLSDAGGTTATQALAMGRPAASTTWIAA